MFRRKNYDSVLMQDLKINKDMNILDVRESDEYASGHIKEAQSMPLSTLQNTYQSLDKNKHYHIVCHSGGRSAQASKFLSSAGYNVTNVMGGMSAYRGPLK